MESHRRDALESLKLRPQFYRTLYRTLLRVVWINGALISILCILTVYLGFYGFKTEHFFTTTPSGRLFELHYTTTPPYSKPRTESPPPSNPAPAINAPITQTEPNAQPNAPAPATETQP